MQTDYSTLQKILSKDFTDTMIRIGLIAFLVVMCARIFAPFANLMIWALILAVTIYPLHQRLAKLLGGRQGRASVVMVLAGLLLIAVPITMLSGSFAKPVQKAYTAFETDTLTIKQPNPKVADWPLVGERIYSSWKKAANNLPAFLKENKDQLKQISTGALSAVANTAGSILLFVAAFIIAGVMMAYGKSGSKAMLSIFNRLTDKDRGHRLQKLCTATVRSVASGVLGVAFIQALLVSIGFTLSGIPAAGVLTFIVMLVGIMQIPALIITLPAIAYLWGVGEASTMSNIFFSMYLIAASISDNFLKPLLLGRGVNAPMPVILLGALGGMISAGIIGLFIGAVVLAVGYKIFMNWVDNGEETDAATTYQNEASGSAQTEG